MERVKTRRSRVDTVGTGMHALKMIVEAEGERSAASISLLRTRMDDGYNKKNCMKSRFFIKR